MNSRIGLEERMVNEQDPERRVVLRSRLQAAWIGQEWPRRLGTGPAGPPLPRYPWPIPQEQVLEQLERDLPDKVARRRAQ